MFIHAGFDYLSGSPNEKYGLSTKDKMERDIISNLEFLSL